MTKDKLPEHLKLEWSNLRQEIFELDKACLSILQYCIVLTSGIILLFTKNPNSNIKVNVDFVFVAISIIWTLFYMYTHHKRSRISTIGSYLKKFVENQNLYASPLWTTRLSQYRKIRYSEAQYLLSAVKPSHVEFLFALIVQIVAINYFELIDYLKCIVNIPECIVNINKTESCLYKIIPIICLCIIFILFIYQEFIFKPDKIWNKIN